MPALFDKHGGFRKLHTFTLATIVQFETLRFCRRFLTFDHRAAGAKFYDPKGRQYDQMTQAARSERLMTKRIEAREQQQTADAPDSPQCGKPMRRRKSAKGDFWGCSAFPDCKGTWPT